MSLQPPTAMSVDRAPPPCWSETPSIGQVIPLTPFLTLKTPIDSAHFTVAEANTFTLPMFIRYQSRIGQNVGLVIDLTDGRFYTQQVDGVAHVTYYVPPTQTPQQSYRYDMTDAVVSGLHSIIRTFIAAHPTQHIAVHDIYGYSLPLFLIATFMVECMDCDVAYAYQAVCTSRPPGLYEHELISALFARYEESVEFDLSIIEPPQWIDGTVTQTTWSGVGAINDTSNSIIPASSSQTTSSAIAASQSKAGTIKRKKKTTASASTSSTPAAVATSTTATTASSPHSTKVTNLHASASSAPVDPIAELLSSAGVQSNRNSSSSGSDLQSSLTGIKRKRPPQAASTQSQNMQNTVQINAHQPAITPAAALSKPLPTPSPSQTTQNAVAKTIPLKTMQNAQLQILDIHALHRLHTYLIRVKPPHLERILDQFQALCNRLHNQTSFDTSALASHMNYSHLTTSHLSTILEQPSAYVLTWQPQGIECTLLVLQEGCFLILHRGQNNVVADEQTESAAANTAVYNVPALSFPSTNGGRLRDCLLTAQLCWETLVTGTSKTADLLITDCLLLSGQPLTKPSIVDRLHHCDSQLIMPRAQHQSITPQQNKCPLQVRAKKLFPLNKMTSVFNMQLPHKTNGICIIRTDNTTQNTQQVNCYVWLQSGQQQQQQQQQQRLEETSLTQQQLIERLSSIK